MKDIPIRQFDVFFLFMLGAVLWVLYYPALLGSRFIGDDYANLQALSEIGIDGYASYIFSGISSSLGRPLSLLTFALQYRSWPLDAFVFKAVNLFIHMLNGIMVFFLARKLAGHLKFSVPDITIISCSVTALWLLHPIQLTTTLYIIQRMTALSAFFTLAGILFYLRFRPAIIQEALSGKGVITGLGIYLFIVLAILSKENGILLPLYILIIEATICSQDIYNRARKIWNWIFLGMPLLSLCLYLAVNLDKLMAVYKYRSYSVYERLLTETVVLFDYLYKIVLPYTGAFTIFHDDFVISTGIFSPPLTFFSLCGLAVLLAVSIIKRRQWPIISFGILWFFAGHLLESSFIGLELYFEHRNYLPSMGVIFLMVGMLMTMVRNIDRKNFVFFVFGIYQVLFLAITVMEIRLWASPMQQAREWARHHPQSARAHGRLGDAYIITGDIQGAIRTYKEIADLYPDEVYPELKQIALRACATEETIPDESWRNIYVKAATATADKFGNIAELALIISTINEGECRGINTNNLNKLILILAENPAFKHMRSYLFDQAALLALYTGDLSGSLDYVQQSLKFSPSIPRALFKAELLLAAGDNTSARETINIIEKRMQKNYREKLAYQNRLTALKSQYRID